jgi:SpoVK/Ycf46/Vps4 family AAA+-type ATPase
MGSGGNYEGGMHPAHRQVESEVMNWLQDEQEENNFVKNDIFIIITTNHKDKITGPLLRSGRIDLVIDIGDFDEKGMVRSFLSASSRMKNRGITVVGFNDNYEKLQEKIDALDLDRISEIAKQKGFTVRDVDMLIIEMAAHDYYYKKGGAGIEWNTENFINVLNDSKGSTREDSTAELVLGDRFIFKKN